MEQSVQAILVSLDGVLCHSAPYSCSATAQFLREQYRAEVSYKDFFPSFDGDKRPTWTEVAEVKNIKLQMPNDKARCYATYLAAIQGCLSTTPGANALIALVRANPAVKFGLLADYEQVKTDATLRQINISKSVFDSMAYHDETASCVVPAAVFLNMAEKWGVAPENCLLISECVELLSDPALASMPKLALTECRDEASFVDVENCETTPSLEALPEWLVAQLEPEP